MYRSFDVRLNSNSKYPIRKEYIILKYIALERKKKVWFKVQTKIKRKVPDMYKIS